MPQKSKEAMSLEVINSLENMLKTFLSANEQLMEKYRWINGKVKDMLVFFEEIKKQLYSEIPSDKAHNN